MHEFNSNQSRNNKDDSGLRLGGYSQSLTSSNEIGIAASINKYIVNNENLQKHVRSASLHRDSKPNNQPNFYKVGTQMHQKQNMTFNIKQHEDNKLYKVDT